jgi:hypothetical protein
MADIVISLSCGPDLFLGINWELYGSVMIIRMVLPPQLTFTPILSRLHGKDEKIFRMISSSVAPCLEGFAAEVSTRCFLPLREAQLLNAYEAGRKNEYIII